MTSFPDQAQYVVVGGGIMGCATAYHLAKSGCKDVVLIERAKLTSGSTWHAAGAVAQYRSNANLMYLIAYGVDLYARLEAETGQATGWRQLGGMRLTTNKDRRKEYERSITTARSFGLEMQLLTPREAQAKFPLVTVDDVDCALYVPTDGTVSPSDVTMALARGARQRGVRIFEDTRATGFQVRDGRLVGIETSRGTIRCERAALCTGIWSREVGKLAGVNVAIQPSHHCYFVTERIDGITPDLPFMRDPDLWHYFREEVGGLMVGQYEPDPIPFPSRLPEDFEFRLMPENLDHFMPHLIPLLKRIPALESVGIKKWFNGLESFTEDQQPVLGESPEVSGLFVGCGFNAYGISAGGGFGMALAHWMQENEPPFDLWACDVRRFGAPHRSDRAVLERAVEGQGRHYTIHWPFEEVTATRPLRRSALYDRLKASRACFGEKAGWERPTWFAPEGVEPVDGHSFGKPRWFSHVAAEHAACRNAAMVLDMSSFSKALLVGRDAEGILQRLCSPDMSMPVGKVAHTLMLNRKGGIECDMTVARIERDAFYLVMGTATATRDFARIRGAIPADAHASLIDQTSAFGVLAVMGPRSREILQSICEDDLGNDAFPFGQTREVCVAGAPVRALRITFVGELGWELHIPTEFMLTVYDTLKAAGAPHGLRDGGYRALDSLRLEKANKIWAADISPDDTPLEAGIRYAVSFRKNVDFVGRAALLAQRDAPLRKRLAIVSIEDSEILLLGRETIYRNGERIGWLRSGGYGHTVKRGIGLGYVTHPEGVTDDFLASGAYELEVAMQRVPATMHLAPLYDPKGERPRG